MQTGQGFASAQDVADMAGVSRSAVSRCFTPGASIAPETRVRVLAAAEALGYQVNDLARGLIARQSRLVGLVVSRPEVGFRAHLTSELARLLIARGSIPVLIDIGRGQADQQAARSILFGHRAEATVILSGSPPASFVDLARRNGQPLIVIGRNEPDCDAVHVENAAAARHAAEVFAATAGARPGLIGSESATPSVTEREDAFRAALSRLGLPEAVWERGADSDHAGGFDAALRMLSRPARPNAIFCINDPMAFGAIDAARSLGLAVPGDVQIIGFDDVPEASWPAYDLTTFRQAPDRVARAAISLIDRRRDAPSAPPLTIDVPAPFIARGSTLSAQKST